MDSRSRIIMTVACAGALLVLAAGCAEREPAGAGDVSWEVAEAELSGATIPNLALGRPASQSTTYLGADAGRATDGITDGNWDHGSVTHTALESYPWWQVDLGAVWDLGEIVVYNRTDCCKDRLTTFTVHVSMDGVTWQPAGGWGGPAQVRLALSIGGTGRFVRLWLHGTNYLSLAEVEIRPRNLARGNPTSQSSTFAGGSSARAVDGITDGHWDYGSVTHTDFDPQPWWQVDLGALTDIGLVVLYNRTDCCGDRLSDLDVQLSSDGTTWTTAVAHTGAAPARLPLLVGAAGRYVRVRLSGTGYLSLAEVEVFPQ